MEIFNTLQEYKNIAKIGDIITLGGTGLICGLNPTSKQDCFKVTKLDSQNGFVSFKKYRGKNSFSTATQQQIGLINPTEYKKLL